jgi:hypothetical protein
MYARWMADALAGPIPKETRATCDDCAMCVHAERPLLPTEYAFNPATKCCTYIPEVPNFLLGKILVDGDPSLADGRALVEARLVENNAVTPFGLGRPPGYMVFYRTVSDQSFGRLRSLRCPYYIEEGGRCGIWKHRESMCATWYCKHTRGAVGMRFWRALHQLLFAIERALTVWCINELDLGAPTLRRLFPPLFTRSTGGDWQECIGDLSDLASLWGNWYGREREFFIECARRVEPLAWKDVLALAGPEVQTVLTFTRDAYQALLSEDVPPSLRVGAMRLVGLGPRNGQFWSYSNLDGMEMPLRVIEMLHVFDGRPTHEAIHEVYMETGVDLDEGVVRQLADFEVLVPAADLVRKR